MQLLVDIGNSRTKYLFINQDEFSQSQVVNNDLLNDAFLNKQWQGVSTIVIANVNQSQVLQPIIKWSKQHKIPYQLVQSERKKKSVTSAYLEPQQLGVDRWLALIGAATKYPNQDVLIIDAGTATTIDLLSASGQHLGGWIVPGIETMFASVLSTTAQVHAEKLPTPSLAFGQCTTDNVNNACWGATVGAITLAFKQAKQQMPHLSLLVFTGGNAGELEKLIDLPVKVEQQLIFHGLAQYL